jgi:murein DD-endopeptidase MepM/ murein hydrolase activator NlpD
MKKNIIIGIAILMLLSYSIFTPTVEYTNYAKEYNVSSSDISSQSSMFIDASLEFGVPASILMAMAIEETSFGTAGVAKPPQNNWFGMEKTSLWPTDPSYTGRFEVYPDAKSSVRDAARLLGSPKSVYKITNIIINNGGLDGAYDKIAASVTSHWCVNEPGYPCSYDAQTLLDDIEKYNLKQYDSDLKNLSVDELKAILDKYYGKNAVPIPGYESVQTGWDGSYTEPDLSNNTVNSIYFNTSYSGNIEEGYIYKKYSDSTMWTNIETDSDEKRVDTITRRIFIQGEILYGDGLLHADDFAFNGTDEEAPGDETSIDNGTPLSCYTAVTSSFNNQESFRTSKHKGLDLAAPLGTTIYSVTDGVVTAVHGGCGTGYYGNTCGSGYGNYVKVKASDGTIYIYAHMKTTPSVKLNETITKGQKLGIVGSSGSSTGPHLHFEVKKNNTSVNPLPYANVSLIPKCQL